MTSTQSEISASQPSDWSYTAEGGANLVLSYTGTTSAILRGKAIRLRKRKVIKPVSSSSVTTTSGHDPAGEVDVRFSDQVILPLLGKDQVVQTEKVPVEKAFLQGLADVMRTRKDRPVNRVEVDEVDTQSPCVVLTEDLIHGPGVLAVEIKPKWGFLPSPTHLSSESKPYKTQHCRFCMHSRLKAQEEPSSNTPISYDDRYCPLDLYSRDEVRVSNAVKALVRLFLASEGSANNLRFFVNGKKVSTSSEDLNVFEARLRDLAPNSLPSQIDLAELASTILVPHLLESPLLSTLSRLQSSLDSLDIEGVFALLEDPSNPTSLESLSQPTVEEWVSWLERWTCTSSRDSKDSTLEDTILSYLLSATFKDCSIILRIPLPVPTASQSSSLKAIDLDPKPIARLSKYRKLDREIVDSFSAWKSHEEATTSRRVPPCVAPSR
ncbi:DUF941-domain-containing protein [Meredithblackwellia eburnea MCA 4105]